MEVSKRLMERGHKVTVVSESFTSEESLRQAQGHRPRCFSPEVFKGPIYHIPVGKNEKLKKFQIWWWLWKNRNLINEAEIVHCHDVFYWYLPYRFLFPKKPVFITFHGWEGKYPVPKRFILARKIWEKLCWGNICVGDYLKKWYGTKADFVTYGGVAGKEEQMGQRRQRGQGGEIKIVFVGRLEKDIGLPIYFKVLEILKKEKIKFEIEFYGDGSLRKEAEKYGKVFGFVENVMERIAHADIVFASSYLVVLEALSLRKAVVSVWDNQLKKNYLLLSPFEDLIISGSESKEVAEKIINLLKSQKEVEKLTDRGYRWAREQTWKKVADLYLRLWYLR